MNNTELVLGVLGTLFVPLLVLLVVFIVLREFWTWYWKQSEQVRLLKRLVESLERIEQRGGTLGGDQAAAIRLGLAPLPPQAPARRPTPAVPATTG